MANLPSVKTLSEVFEDAAQARKILEMSKKELLELPACKEPAHFHGNWERQPIDRLQLLALNALESGLFGEEHVELKQGTASYLNTGDMYAATLIFWNGRYRVQALGDFIEIQERAGNTAS